MNIITLSPHYEIEIEQRSEMAFCLNVRYVLRDSPTLDQYYMGTIYGNFIEEPIEDTRKYWSIHFYIEQSNPVKVSDQDIARIFTLIRENNLFQEPAILTSSEIPPYEKTRRKSFQIGKIYYDDPEPYLSLEEQLNKK